MKKYLSVFLAVVIIAVSESIGGFVSVNAGTTQSDGYDSVLFYDNFKDYTEDTSLTNAADGFYEGKSHSSGGITHTVADTQKEGLPGSDIHGYAAKIQKSADVGTDNYFRIKNSVLNYDFAKNPKVKVSYSVFIPSGTNFQTKAFNVSISDGSVSFNIAKFTAGNIVIADNDGTENSVAYSEGEWIDFLYYFDFSNGSLSAYVNSVSLADDIDIGGISGIQRLNYSMDARNGGYSVYVDDIGIQTLPPFEFVSASVNDGFKDYNIMNRTVEISYKNVIDSIENDTVKVTRNGTEFDDFTVDFNGNKIFVTFDDFLDFGTKYKISVGKNMMSKFGQTPEKNTEIEFETMSTCVVSSLPVIGDADENALKSFPSDGKIYAYAKIQNPFDEGKKGTVYLQIFDADGKLLVQESTSQDLKNGLNSVSVSADCDGGAYARAFVCDSAESMNLLSDEYAELGEKIAENPVQDINRATVSASVQTDYENSRFVIEGTLSPESVKTLLIKISDKDGDIVFITPAYSDKDGNFTVEYVFGTDFPYGTYNIDVMFRGASSVYGKTADYLNAEITKDVLDGVNNAEAVFELIDIIYKNRNVLGLDETTISENTYNIILEQKRYKSFNEIIDIIKLADNVLMALNNTEYDMLSDVILKYESVILPSSENIAAYKNMSDSDRNAVNYNIKSYGKFGTVKSFRNMFDKAVSSVKSGIDTEFSNDGYNNILLCDDFSGYGKAGSSITESTATIYEGKSYDGITHTVADAGSEGVSQPEEHGLIAKIYKSDSVGTDNYFRFINNAVSYDSKKSPNIKIEYDIYIPAGTNFQTKALNVSITDGAESFTLAKFSAGQIIVVSSDGKEYKTAYNEGEWIKCTSYMDFNAGTCTSNINGKPLADNVDMGKISGISRMSFSNDARNGAYTWYLDNLNLSTYDVFEIVKSSVKSGYESYIPGERVFEIELGNRIGQIDKTAVTVTKNGKAFEDFIVYPDGNKIKVEFSDCLDFNTNYSINIGGKITNNFGNTLEESAVINFKTIGEKMFSTAPLFLSGERGYEIKEIPDNGIVYVYAEATNPLKKSYGASVVICMYDSDGNMIDLKSESVDINPGESEALSLNANVSGAKYIKAFVCDESDGMTLLNPNFAQLSENSAENIVLSSGTAKADVKSVIDYNGHFVKVNGQTEPVKQKAFLISVLDEGGNICFKEPVFSDSDGKFCVKYNFDTDKEKSRYTVNVKGYEVDGSSSVGLWYINDTKQSSVCLLVNESASVSDLINVLSDSKYLFNLSDEYFDENGYNILFEQKEYKNFGDLFDTLLSAREILNEINQTRWDSLSGVIKKYETVLKYGSKKYDSYMKKNTAVQNKINIDIKKSGVFETIKDFREKLDEVVPNYEKPEGGSSGVISGTPAGITSQVPDDSYGVASDITPESTYDSDTYIFDDLDGVLWAKDSILELSRLGIVSGDGNGKYRPLDNVTREEFVKMLIEALNIDVSEDECTFSDAVKGEWYEKYLAAAQKTGLLLGNPDGSAGIGQFIKRQDMAIMVYRAVLGTGKELKSLYDEIHFDDENEIAQYAYEAVLKIQQAGIISGMGNNTFAPVNNADRVQAAKIIFSLISAIQ